MVQLEFFLLDLGGSLSAAVQDSLQRSLEGGSAKKVLRLLDREEDLLMAVQAYEELSDRTEELMAPPFPRGHIARWLHPRRIRRLLTEQDQFRETILTLAKICAREAIENRDPLAIEQMDRTFRYVRDDEEHELLEATQAATAVWIFVFPRSANLRADAPGHVLAKAM